MRKRVSLLGKFILRQVTGAYKKSQSGFTLSAKLSKESIQSLQMNQDQLLVVRYVVIRAISISDSFARGPYLLTISGHFSSLCEAGLGRK